MDVRSSYLKDETASVPQLSTSSIHISKNWVLPERLKPGRKPGSKAGGSQNSQNVLKQQPVQVSHPHVRHSALASSLLGSGPATLVSVEQPGSSCSASNSDSNSPIQMHPTMERALSENYDIAPRPSAVSTVPVDSLQGDSLQGDPLGSTGSSSTTLIQESANASALEATPRTGGSGDSVARRRKQNRDAQRAYRERKANRIHVLEDAVAGLQDELDAWRARANAAEQQVVQVSDQLAGALRENQELRVQAEMLRSRKRVQVDEVPSSLENMIQNFTPMKAMPLLKKKKVDKSELPDMSVWKPGSCGNCKKDPNNKAFCKSIFKGNTNPNSSLPPQFEKLETEITSEGLPDMSVWKPGSCGNCKKDPNNKAFCKSIFKGNTNPNSSLPPNFEKLETEITSQSLPDMNVWKPGSCANCKADPNNKAFCKSIFKGNTNPNSSLPPKFKKMNISSKKTPCQGGSGPCCSGCKDKKPGAVQEISQPQLQETPQPQLQEPEKKTYMAITDTYQRIRKHMTTQYDNECLSKLQAESNKNNTLITVLEKIATNLEINGREVEIKSVERALDGLDH